MEDTHAHKARLEEMLATLTEELTSIGILDPTNSQNWVAIPEGVDPNEPDIDMVADVVEAWDERRALVATLETRYNNVTRALEKVQAGTYGTCEICGAPIEEDRLNANPAARTDKAHMDDEGALPL